MQDVSFHFVLEKTDLAYPHNILRNVAIETVECDYFLAIDVDFIPMPKEKCHSHIQNLIRDKHSGFTSDRQRLFVLPAFLDYRIRRSLGTHTRAPETHPKVTRNLPHNTRNTPENHLQTTLAYPNRTRSSPETHTPAPKRHPKATRNPHWSIQNAPEGHPNPTLRRSPKTHTKAPETHLRITRKPNPSIQTGYPKCTLNTNCACEGHPLFIAVYNNQH